jgi:hypothetical protein
MCVNVEFSYQPPVSHIGLVDQRSKPTVRPERPWAVNLLVAALSFNALGLSF